MIPLNEYLAGQYLAGPFMTIENPFSSGVLMCSLCRPSLAGLQRRPLTRPTDLTRQQPPSRLATYRKYVSFYLRGLGMPNSELNPPRSLRHRRTAGDGAVALFWAMRQPKRPRHHTSLDLRRRYIMLNDFEPVLHRTNDVEDSPDRAGVPRSTF